MHDEQNRNETSMEMNKRRSKTMNDRQTQIKLLLAELSGLIGKHPYLVHSWRFAVGALYALDKSYQYHVERSIEAHSAFHLIQVREVTSQISLGQAPDQIWLAGLYFNAALMRIAALYERSLRSLLIETKLDEKITVIRKGKPTNIKVSVANVNELAALVQDRVFRSVPIRTTTAEKIRKEVNKLKHRVLGVLPQDAVTIDEALQALKEIMDLLCCPQSEQELIKLYGSMVPPA
jgi:hypothetical protein